MSQENISGLTLKEILTKYPPQETTFKTPAKGGGVDITTSQVSRNEDGVIVYIVPGSTKYIERSSKPNDTTG